MNVLLKKLRMVGYNRVSPTMNVPAQTQCNYTNNYYGDQVCVEVKNTRPRNNFHVGVQL